MSHRGDDSKEKLLKFATRHSLLPSRAVMHGNLLLCHLLGDHHGGLEAPDLPAPKLGLELPADTNQ